MKEVLITEGNGLRIVGKNVKTYGCSNFRIFNMMLVYCSRLFRLYPAPNLPTPSASGSSTLWLILQASLSMSQAAQNPSRSFYMTYFLACYSHLSLGLPLERFLFSLILNLVPDFIFVYF